MDRELTQLAEQMQRARCAAEVFGVFTGNAEEQMEQAAVAYRQLVKIAHPDRYKHNGDQATALETFKLLQELWREAQAQIQIGTYGDGTRLQSVDPVMVQAGKHQYVVQTQMAAGDFCNLYHCMPVGDPTRAVFKVAVDPGNNDLVAHEAHILHHLHADKAFEKLHIYIPTVHDAFAYKDPSNVTRRVNILQALEGFYSLKEVRAEYRNGVDPRDMVWIWRRLLVALGLAHINGVIHGAVLPEHVLIHPEMHGLVLVDWTCAVMVEDASCPAPYIPAMNVEYEPWYPPEIKARQSPLPGTDIYMAVQCMIYLLGGDPATGVIPEATPRPFVRFFKGCLQASPRARPQDTWKLLEEFDEVIERLWGKRTFHPFVMPRRDFPRMPPFGGSKSARTG
ncbi:MAG: molecular chaperone DnaJ [Anaerolineae bacterium]